MKEYGNTTSKRFEFKIAGATHSLPAFKYIPGSVFEKVRPDDVSPIQGTLDMIRAVADEATATAIIGLPMQEISDLFNDWAEVDSTSLGESLSSEAS